MLFLRNSALNEPWLPNHHPERKSTYLKFFARQFFRPAGPISSIREYAPHFEYTRICTPFRSHGALKVCIVINHKNHCKYIMLIKVPTHLYCAITVFLEDSEFLPGEDFNIITSVELEHFYLHFINHECYVTFTIKFGWPV